MTFLITGVTLGDVSATGDDSYVSNAADLVLVASWDSAAIPAPVVSPDVSGALVSLDLSESYKSPAGSAVSLTLSGAPFVYAGAVDSARFGIPTAGNAAQAAYPVGWESFAYGFTTRATFDLSSRELPLSIEGAYTSPTALNVGLYLDGKPLVSAASIGDQTEFGSASVESPLSARPFGFDASDHSIPRVHRGETGARVELRLDAHYQSLHGSSVSLPLSGAPLVLASAGLQQLFGLPSVANASQAFYPFGFDSTGFGYRTRAFRSDLDSGNLSLSLEGNYAPPNAAAIQLLWASESKTLSPFGFTGLQLGEPIVRVAQLFLEGIQPPADAVPAPSLKNLNRTVSPLGTDFLESGAHHSVANSGVAVRPTGISHPGLGAHRIWNWRQYRNMQGFNTALYGRPYLQGGVKYITPSGVSTTVYGRPSVVNTTADQFVSLAGRIAPPWAGRPAVSPRTVFPYGVLGATFGSAFVQFPPRPVGWLSSAFGYPVIEDKTKYLAAGGIGADDQYGYPVVFDPTIKVLVSSVIQSGVFGDTAVKNNRFVLNAEGIDSASVSPWATLRNTRRLTYASGWRSLDFGESSVTNKTPSIAPVGFDALRLPNPAEIGISYAVRLIYTSGINKGGIGVATLTKTPEIAPKGIAAPTLGLTTVWHRVRTLEVRGADAYKSGSADVWFRYRFVQLQDRGWNGSAYGAPRLEHEHRAINGLGADSLRSGTPYIGLRNRTIAPESAWEDFATGHMVGGLRFLRPVGYEATRWGTRIIPEITQVYVRGFSNSYGIPTLRNNTNLILPAGITTTPDPVDQWGTAKLHNSRQFVSMFYDVDSELNPPKWSQWTLIENRNKYLATTGNEMLRIGRSVVANAATAVIPSAILAPEWSKASASGMVAFRIRPLNLDSIEPPYFSGWLNIYNDAPVLGSKGFNAESFGVSVVENTRRTFKFQGFDSAWFGYPMVAFRIRHIKFEGRYTIAPPPIRMQEVKLYTRYLDPIGYETYGSGAQSLSIHWTLITPRWTHQDLFGEPRVHNVTPEVKTRGRVSEEFGNAFVRLEWRELITHEAFTQIIPKPIVAFRDRAIEVNGIRSMVFGDKLKVTKTGAPPYSDQLIILANADVTKNGYGIEVPKDQVPKPIMNQQVLYHRSDSVMTKFGSLRITANMIRVEPGFQELSVGEPMVSLKIRTVEVKEFPGDQIFQPSKPRLSPHTIWAVKEAPAQAKVNHTSSSLHYVDEYPGSGWRKGFGRPSVFLYTGLVNTRGANHAAVGKPSAYNALSYIRPKGIKLDRYGWHTVPGEQISEQINSSDTMVFGITKVGRPPYVGPQTIAAKGLSAIFWGASDIQLLHRQIYPRGHLSMAMGTRRGGDSPYMWQGLRIGELMPTIPEGFSAELIGEPWLSFRVREVNPDGYDAFISDYDLTAFSRRMKVFRKEVPSSVDHIKPEGFDAFASSASDVKPLAHFIRPDGNSDQYRKGAF
ncbi:hypothetical protein DARTUKUTA_50 [Bacillus phage vB_BspP_Dartukuta]|nr:hypothetical protein DARTUKUTA_50 [Bacillus phage vB_BspP_Dartukuta]